MTILNINHSPLILREPDETGFHATNTDAIFDDEAVMEELGEIDEECSQLLSPVGLAYALTGGQNDDPANIAFAQVVDPH